MKTRLVAAELFHAGGVTEITKLNSRFPKFCLCAQKWINDSWIEEASELQAT